MCGPFIMRLCLEEVRYSPTRTFFTNMPSSAKYRGGTGGRGVLWQMVNCRAPQYQKPSKRVWLCGSSHRPVHIHYLEAFRPQPRKPRQYDRQGGLFSFSFPAGFNIWSMPYDTLIPYPRDAHLCGSPLVSPQEVAAGMADTGLGGGSGF